MNNKKNFFFGCLKTKFENFSAKFLPESVFKLVSLLLLLYCDDKKSIVLQCVRISDTEKKENRLSHSLSLAFVEEFSAHHLVTSLLGDLPRLYLRA